MVCEARGDFMKRASNRQPVKAGHPCIEADQHIQFLLSPSQIGVQNLGAALSGLCTALAARGYSIP